MNRILLVALRDYRQVIATRAFKVTLLVLHLTGERRVVLAEAAGEYDDRQGHARDHDPERRICGDEQGDHNDVLRDIDDEEDGTEAEEAPDRREIGRGA